MTSLSRYGHATIEPGRYAPLGAGNAALSEARTIFPKTVKASHESPRFLISGHNNPKLGKEVRKGARTGWPIYQLTLEERATCPTSCLQWASCYGNAMPFARRHKIDANFERYLEAEIITLCREHQDGLLIRLHVLGDFYSVEYVYLWARLLAEFPQLHVFGYTAHCLDDGDEDSRRIARAINVLTEGMWDRFAIRTSGGVEERSVAMVFDDQADADALENPNLIVCPAQTHKTEACATCTLCWSAPDKAIGFLRHGRKLKAGPNASPKTLSPKAERPTFPKPAKPKAVGKRGVTAADRARDAVQAAAERLWPTNPKGLTSADLVRETGLDYPTATSAAAALARKGLALWVYASVRTAGAHKVLLPTSASVEPDTGLSKQQAAVLEALKAAHAKSGHGDLISTFRKPIAEAAGIPNGSSGDVFWQLERKGLIEPVQKGGPHTPTTYRIAGVEPRKPAEAVQAPAPVARPANPTPPARLVESEPAPLEMDFCGDLRGTGPRILALRLAGECAFPLNDPGKGRMDEMLMCCDPAQTGSPYCEKHAARVWQRSRASTARPEVRA